MSPSFGVYAKALDAIESSNRIGVSILLITLSPNLPDEKYADRFSSDLSFWLIGYNQTWHAAHTL